MGLFYFDESIHERAGFIIGAFVYFDEPIEGRVTEIFRDLGLAIGEHEFHSGSHFGRNPHLAKLRARYQGILQNSQLAITVIPSSERKMLGKDSLVTLAMVIENNGLTDRSHEVYFDQGIFPNLLVANQLSKIAPLSDCRFHFEQDSRLVLGIQLADLAAHSCSTMLLEALGVIKKTVKAGEGSGYHPDTDIEIGFEMFATLRYTFFHPPILAEDIETDPPVAKVTDYGLRVAPSCSEELAQKANERFGKMYLGCIH